MRLRWPALVLVSFLQAAFAAAQQRPLLTERVETVDRGSVRLELGFEFLQDAVFPLSGLEGDLTRIGVLGLRLGVGERVEVQILGSAQDFLNVKHRFDAPNSDKLDFSGDSTSDVGDFTLATKIRVSQERSAMPALGVRFGVELPNASNESGLGNDQTNAFGEFLLEKHWGRLGLWGSAGLIILGDPLEPASQDDLFTYGVALSGELHQNFSLVGEISGRTGPGGIGTEDRSRARAGARIQAAGMHWDLAGFWGLEETDPSWGILLGVSKTFSVF